MKSNFFVFFLLVFGIPFSVQAQSSRQEVSGVVTDTLSAGLAGATVVLLESSDSTLVSYGVTKSDGSFRLRRVKSGTYEFQVSFVGFAPYSASVSVNNEPLNLGPIALREASTELDELVVTADHIPMLVKKDTLEYNAAAFRVRPNANVEELLKRLPGVDIERDGTIRAQGETVEKVLVDGNEFFGDDPKIATQNLPADAVDKVQVYDKQSDMAEFSGVDDGEETKTINLALKEDAKQGYFGNATGGYGNDEFTSPDNFTNRYEGKATINRFSPTTQLSFIGNLNNINEQGFSINDVMSFMGGIQSMMNLGGPRGGGIPISSGVSDGFSVTTAAGLNFNRDFNSKTSLQSSYFFNAIDNNQNRTINQQQLIGDVSSSNSLQSALQDMLTQTHRLNLNLKHKINDSQDLRLRATLNASSSDLTNDSNRDLLDGSNLLVNDNFTQYDSDGKDKGGRASLIYRKKLSDRGRTLVAEARATLNDGSLDGRLDALNAFYDNIGNVMSSEEISQLQAQLNTTFTNKLELSWTEPLGRGRFLELHAERRQNSEDQDKQIFDLQNGQNVLNVPLSAALDQTYTYNRGGLNLRFVSEDRSLNLGLDLQDAQLNGSIQGQNQSIKNNSNKLLPRATFRNDFGGSKNLELRYQASTREPSMRDLQPFADNSDPLNIYVGNPDLQPEYRHSGTLHFMLFDQFTFTNLFTYFQASYTSNKIALARTIDNQLKQSITSVNVDGDWLLNGSLNFGTPIRAIGTKINLSTRTMYNRSTEFINDQENDARILRQTFDVRLENRKKDVIDALIGARFTFNVTKYSLNSDLSQNYLNKTFYTDLTYSLGDNWRFTTGLDYRTFADEVFGTGQNLPIWRAEISRTLMGNKAEVQLVGLDLLNKNVSVNYSNTSTYIREEQINSLGRYIMLKFVYNLSGIGGQNTGIGFDTTH